MSRQSYFSPNSKGKSGWGLAVGGIFILLLISLLVVVYMYPAQKRCENKFECDCGDNAACKICSMKKKKEQFKIQNQKNANREKFVLQKKNNQVINKLSREKYELDSKCTNERDNNRKTINKLNQALATERYAARGAIKELYAGISEVANEASINSSLAENRSSPMDIAKNAIMTGLTGLNSSGTDMTGPSQLVQYMASHINTPMTYNYGTVMRRVVDYLETDIFDNPNTYSSDISTNVAGIKSELLGLAASGVLIASITTPLLYKESTSDQNPDNMLKLNNPVTLPNIGFSELQMASIQIPENESYKALRAVLQPIYKNIFVALLFANPANVMKTLTSANSSILEGITYSQSDGILEYLSYLSAVDGAVELYKPMFDMRIIDSSNIQNRVTVVVNDVTMAAGGGSIESINVSQVGKSETYVIPNPLDDTNPDISKIHWLSPGRYHNKFSRISQFSRETVFLSDSRTTIHDELSALGQIRLSDFYPNASGDPRAFKVLSSTNLNTDSTGLYVRPNHQRSCLRINDETHHPVSCSNNNECGNSNLGASCDVSRGICEHGNNLANNRECSSDSECTADNSNSGHTVKCMTTCPSGNWIDLGDGSGNSVCLTSPIDLDHTAGAQGAGRTTHIDADVLECGLESNARNWVSCMKTATTSTDDVIHGGAKGWDRLENSMCNYAPGSSAKALGNGKNCKFFANRGLDSGPTFVFNGWKDNAAVSSTEMNGYDGDGAPTSGGPAYDLANAQSSEFFVSKTAGSDYKKVVFWGADWCGWTKKTRPAFDEVMTLFETDTTVDMQYIECANEADMTAAQIALKAESNVLGYPTICMYDGSDALVSTFSDERTAEAISSWIRNS